MDLQKSAGSDSGSHSGQSYLWAEPQRQHPDRRLRKIWRSRSARTFSWQDETIIPWGGDNGSVIYWVIFTPDEEAAKLYAPCEIEVSVQTQIGVNVEFTADSQRLCQR